MENLLKWHDSFGTEIEKLDEQHKAFFEFVNEAYRLSDVEREELIALIGKIREHNTSHFTYEEEMLYKFEYPDHIRHKKKHEDFSGKLNEIEEALQASVVGSREKLVMLLAGWVRDHILQDDKYFAEYLRNRGVK